MGVLCCFLEIIIVKNSIRFLDLRIIIVDLKILFGFKFIYYGLFIISVLNVKYDYFFGIFKKNFIKF